MRGSDPVSNGLGSVRLRRRALPERDLAAVSLRTQLLGRTLQAPIVVSAVTTAPETRLELARAAAAHGVGLVLGGDSPPPAGHRPPLLLADLGAAQVRVREGLWRAAERVERLDADGLSVSLDPLQEAVRPEGRPELSGVAESIAAVAAHLAPLPVVVRAGGGGMDFDDVALLREAGVAAIDVLGGGGAPEGAVAVAFDGWGVSVAEALTDARAAAPGLPLIASGGVRDGVDVARCLALGATAGGLAGPLPGAEQAVGAAIEQLRIATWLAGAGHAQELGREHLR